MSRSQLFTSLTQLKQELSNGRGVPMTPVSASATTFIDPDSVPGHGALTEDEDRGLKCPIRGCGVWSHSLAVHLNYRHKNVGGAKAVREALGIPPSVGLLSSRQHARLRQIKLEMYGAHPELRERRASTARRGQRGGDHLARGAKIAATKLSGTVANLRDRCEAQLSHKIIDLHNKLGRSPSLKEFKEEYGGAVADAVARTFGSWNAAKERCGLEVYQRGCSPKMRYTFDAILEMLKAWHEMHGKMPSSLDAQMPTRVPLIPGYSAIRDAFQNADWNECMARASRLLGLPEHQSEAA